MKRLLLVEDNEMNSDMLKRRLEVKGFKVAVAKDGVEAVEMARAEKPNLIIMDMGLPVIDGWEATRKIKSATQTRDIPILALTAHAMSGDRERSMEAGCDEYDTKPVDFFRLLSKIQDMLLEATA